MKFHHELNQTVENSLSATATPGVAVALLLDGQPVFVAGSGFRDLKKTTALDSEARFYIYSVTKSLIAGVVLRLVQRGSLGLDEAVQTYLPDLALDRPVTIRQLLNHTGGIPDYGGLMAYFEALKAEPKHPWSANQFLAETLSKGLIFEPGQGWAYSNIGYLLLRQVIERVLVKSLRAALHEHIFAPLGLSGSFAAESLADAQVLTPGYSAIFSSDKTMKDIRAVYHPGWVSHGVVIASALDLARMFDSILSGQAIDGERRAAMLTAIPVPVKHPLFQQPGYGLGVMVDTGSRWGLMAGHGGGGPGYSAGVIHLPDVHGRRITSAALANSDQSDLGLQVAFELAERMAGSL
jgi:D-alanyl-D-alanine carboxypeptidase